MIVLYVLVISTGSFLISFPIRTEIDTCEIDSFCNSYNNTAFCETIFHAIQVISTVALSFLFFFNRKNVEVLKNNFNFSFF